MTAHQGTRVQQVCNWKETHDENYVVRFGQRGENCSRARDTQPIRGVSDELARGCKRWHPLAPGRRYGKKKSSLWVYVSPAISQLTTNSGAFLRIKWEIYFYKEVLRSFIEFRKARMRVSSSSSCRATSTDIPDPLSPLFPIIHRLWQVFRVTSCILT